MLKTASFYIRKDIILSSMMVLAVALACGLFISMSIFINSFQSAVSDWIIKSTQSDLYIQSKHNTIPTPVAISEADLKKIQSHPAVKSWRMISRDNVMINNKEIMLRASP